MTAIEVGNQAGIAIEVLEGGAMSAIRAGPVLINQVIGSPLDGGLGNVYVRRRTRAGVTSFPLIGPGSPGTLQRLGDGARWSGAVDGLDYSLALRLSSESATWFWTVQLTNTSTRWSSLDAVLAQDLGLAHEAAVRGSELYTSQYIDHTILEDERFGFLLCSRQNLPQDGAAPWIMHGCLDGAVGYLTDGFQFYGLDYKASNVPAALGRRTLPNRNYQYEVAMPTLQSRRLWLAPGASGEVTFFAVFEADHPAASGAADGELASSAARTFRRLPAMTVDDAPRPQVVGIFDAPRLVASRDLGVADLERYFGAEWRHVEERDGAPLSFFHGYQQHVVLRAKELLMERPTGHIMRSGVGTFPSDDILAATAWMYGVFGSQVTIGNTSFNKIISACRNPLNVLKASGLRIFVRTEGEYELLGLPSAFEMGPNSARWIYQDEGRTLSIRAAAALGSPAYRLAIDVERGGPLQFLISHAIVLGETEGGALGELEVDIARARVRMRPAPGTLVREQYPEATFFIVSPEPADIETIGGDELLRADGRERGGSHVVVRTRPVSRFSLVITGSLLTAERAEALAVTHGRPQEFDTERAVAVFWSGLAQAAELAGATDSRAADVGRLNDILRWYLHDAMVHYTTPHGLEQSSGAAWGLRDVCQGPVEFLLATGHRGPVREILRTVYEHQFRRTGDWPQWFMFDRFRAVQGAESHADIIHWPLKALCDYVEATDDATILEERVAYTDDQTMAATNDIDTIFAHTERQIARIEHDCIDDTALMRFGGGDWEDTLQPVDPGMATQLVSAWTVELAYQTLCRYRVVCERAGRIQMAGRLANLCDRIRADFNRHLLPDGVVAGLAWFGPNGPEYFLHPRDRKTGIAYRLLPMTRGMISGIFSVEQATRHAELIERHLLFPDGVRLMNRPMDYHGGISRTFKRAESAASFGREVGLQYVHAHIRYIEAMARIGRPEEAFRGLMAVCPIGLDRAVPSALPRQCNAYFSSSDAAFMDRRQASRQFGRLRRGRVGVKGGWRVYSSGPGIYVNQLISNVLGLRHLFADVVIDPVLPKDADGLTFRFGYAGRSVRYLYHVTGDGYGPREVLVNGRSFSNGRREANPYRPGGMLIPRAAFLEALDRDQNLVEVFL